MLNKISLKNRISLLYLFYCIKGRTIFIANFAILYIPQNFTISLVVLRVKINNKPEHKRFSPALLYITYIYPNLSGPNIKTLEQEM